MRNFKVRTHYLKKKLLTFCYNFYIDLSQKIGLESIG